MATARDNGSVTTAGGTAAGAEKHKPEVLHEVRRALDEGEAWVLRKPKPSSFAYGSRRLRAPRLTHHTPPNHHNDDDNDRASRSR